MDLISIPISIISLVISVGTFWLVFIRRGRLRMTTPTVVFFGYDQTPNPTAKIFIRTLLYCTASRGSVIEGMYAKVHSKDKSKVFTFWGYGETDKLTVGSGLFIDRSGFSANHHFVSSVADDPFQFESGEYRIEIFARETGRRRPTKLETIKLGLNSDLAEALRSYEGVLFEQSMEGDYVGHSRDPHRSIP